jgi:LmbE family N-acetylglucosaminyl deacetylase
MTEGTRVLAVGAHPDDVDFRAGGTLAAYAARGASIHSVVVTDGDRGSWDRVSPNELALDRLDEQRRALEALGAHELICLHRSDGAVYDIPGLRQELCLLYRRLRPTTIITHDPWRRYNPHPDHRAVGWAACDAIVAARNANFYSEQLTTVDTWNPPEVLLFLPFQVNHVVDISTTIERKVAAVLCHGSQLESWAAKAEHRGDDLRRAVRERVLSLSRESGSAAGFEYGERFHRLVAGVKG